MTRSDPSDAAYIPGMSDFDETKHPRGHASNPGAFSGKDNSGPDTVLPGRNVNMVFRGVHHVGSYGYKDAPGLTNRANSAMIRIEMIMARTNVPSAARLALIATVMQDEPVLTDGSVAAIRARKDAKRFGEYAPR